MKIDAGCSSGLEKFFLPGFRFHPTDEELVAFYLKGKICRKKHGDDVIAETDVYNWDPEELPGLSKLKTGDRQWFFFSPRDRKYPNAARSSRATSNGYWKATGKDRVITCGSRSVGVKKTLVFYGGRAPKGNRTDWVMHEYTMDEEELTRCQSAKDYYALYKVFKKSGPGPKNGEQYGAPFREEDWADDEVDVRFVVDDVNPIKEANETKQKPFGDDESLIVELSGSPIDFEEIMTGIADDPIRVPPFDVNSQLSVDQFLGEVENQSSIQSRSCFGLVESDRTQPESEPLDFLQQNVSWPEPCTFEEDFLIEDFLEMSDLIGPEPSLQNLEKLPCNEFDPSEELDFHQMAPGDSNKCEISDMEQNSAFFIDSINQTVQLEPDSQHMYHLSKNGTTEGLFPPTTTGTIHQNRSEFATFTIGSNENRVNEQSDGNESWLSSVLWDFVDSIPTSPALASESALVNRALGRLAGTCRTSGKSLSRFLVVSRFGVLCAILCVVIGAYIRVELM